MKALIAAGGHATRLRPITWTLNKHLIPLANRPMLSHVIDKIVDAGITEIFVNVNPGEMETMRASLGDGSDRGITITYLEQKGGALGIAHAVANAEEYLKGDSFLFFLGDNILLGGIRSMRERFEKEKLDCLVLLSRVKDPQRFGVPELDANGRVIRMYEKPVNPPSPFAVTGIYFFSPEYFEAFKTAKPSARGEYEIMDVINWYIMNRQVGTEEITGWWKDTGNPEALLEGNALIMDDLSREYFVQEGSIDATARLQGLVGVGEGTVIGPDVLIRGPVVIGKHCRIDRSYIGPYTTIGDGSVIEGADVEYSIVFEGAVLRNTPRIIESLIGKKATLGITKTRLPRGGRQLIVGENSVVEM